MICGNEEYLKAYFAPAARPGWTAYKIFNSMYTAPQSWVIEEGSWIFDPQLDPRPVHDCAKGINVAESVDWLRMYIWREECRHFDKSITEFAVWQMFIPDEAEIVVPYNTDGKIRVNQAQLVGIVDYLPVFYEGMPFPGEI